MNALRTILNLCVEKNLCPEGVLELAETMPLSKAIGRKRGKKADVLVDELYTGALQRFPKVLSTYITVAGVQAAESAGVLAADILQVDSGLKGGRKAIVALHEAGLSLSWWLLGLGAPMRTPPKLEEWPGEISLANYIRTLRFKQGWSDLESRWLITQTHESSQHKLAHRVISRVMTGMPRITLFPLMPDVISVYNRLIAAVNAYELTPDAEPWLSECIQLLQNSSWRVCVLMLVRQGSISHWSVVGQQPRRKSERLAYVISLVLDLYGEQEGLTYYMRVLNEEAMSIGFMDLADVVRRAVWNIHLEPKQKD
ncbi:MAG: hypothetical protein IJU76_16060 [Desulfovibrionaceae bacterium]|nr:hypothetical protein [Desulfovibrionaceae bacterium]